MTQDPINLDFSDLIARIAFAAILDRAQPLSHADLADLAGTSVDAVAEAFAKLTQAGRAELDTAGYVVGIYGLSLKTTPHMVSMRSNEFFVWCALDAVGIPAALGESAGVVSLCSFCELELRFSVDRGREPQLPLVVSWQASPCDSVRDEFCPTINFYCDEGHYRRSDVGTAAPEGFLTLSAAADLGRRTWGWAAR